jgi:secondary thiamine-phosphate synthase enzyme
MEFSIDTRSRTEMVDITAAVERQVRASGVRAGLCLVFVPHTTAGVTINESADPDVRTDLLKALEAMVPADAGYRHAEGNSPAHVKASLMGSSQTVAIVNGAPALGTWQGIFLCEFDGPRKRRVQLRILDAPFKET